MDSDLDFYARSNPPEPEPGDLPDLLVRNDFTIWVFTPMTTRGRVWLDSHLDSAPWQWVGGALLVDHRMGQELIELAREDDLEIRLEGQE
jgi:hypothetical protein